MTFDTYLKILVFYVDTYSLFGAEGIVTKILNVSKKKKPELTPS